MPQDVVIAPSSTAHSLRSSSIPLPSSLTASPILVILPSCKPFTASKLDTSMLVDPACLSVSFFCLGRTNINEEPAPADAQAQKHD